MAFDYVSIERTKRLPALRTNFYSKQSVCEFQYESQRSHWCSQGLTKTLQGPHDLADIREELISTVKCKLGVTKGKKSSNLVLRLKSAY